MSEAVDRAIAAFNARDADAFVAAYTQDAVIESLADGVLARGRDELLARYRPMFADCPDLRCDVEARIVSGGDVIQYERVSGRLPEPETLLVIYRIAGDRVAHEFVVR